MKQLILAGMILLLVCNSLRGDEFKSNVNSEQPDWVKMMYSENPDPGEVLEAYNKYYKHSEFVKNEHTQYLKRWLREIGLNIVPSSNNPKEYEAYESNLQKYLKMTFDLRNTSKGDVSLEETLMWTCIGPFDFDKEATERSYAPGSAHCYAIEQSKSNPDVLYCGTATTGLWKSVDKGENWIPLTNDLMFTEVYAIEIDHQDENVIYFEAGKKIYKSSDGGITNTVIGDDAFKSKARNAYDIAIHPEDNNIIFLGAEDGLWISSDAGDNWKKLRSARCQEIEFHPTDRDIIYAVCLDNNKTLFLRSVNRGESFENIGDGWPEPASGDEQKRTEIATTPEAPENVYALCTGRANGGDGLYGVYVSEDEGETWEFRCCGEEPGGLPTEDNINMMGWADDGSDDGGQKYYDLALEVADDNPDIIHVGAVNHWISKDGGYTFTCPAKWSNPGKKEYVHADIHDIQQYGKDLWFACDGGIFYSNTQGDSIYKKMRGITGTDFWGFGAGYWDGDVMLGGTYHNGTLLKDNDVYIDGWISTQGGDNYRGFVNYGNDRMVYHDGGGKILSGDRTQKYKAFPFQKKPNASYIVGESSDLRFDPRCYNIVYSGNGTSLWKSYDNCTSFELVHDFGTKVTSIELGWSNQDYIYVCTYESWFKSKQVWRSTDAGATWTDITPSLDLIKNNEWIPYDIAISSEDEETIWLARTSQYGSSPTGLNGYQVFKSTDAGDTWENYSSETISGEYLTNIIHQRGTNGGVYIGTRRAVYYRNDKMDDWALFNNGLPVQTASTQLVPYYRKSMIRNGTNRSVYEAPLYEKSAVKAQISADRMKSYCIRDTVYYSDHSVMTDENATWHWEFEGGVPETSDIRNPKVIYKEPGVYGLTLTVSDINGSDTQTYDEFIEISDECSPEGVPGFALKTNDAGDYAAVKSIDLNSNRLTFSAWIKPEGVQAEYSGIVMHNSQAAGLNFRPDNYLAYHWPGGQWYWDSKLRVAENEWSHVALVVTPDSITVVLNGVAATHKTKLDSVDFSSGIYIGSYLGWDNRNFNGLIDEVCIWDRPLSLEELRLGMHLTKEPESDESLIAYYQFNRSAGIITDRVGISHASPSGASIRMVSTAPIGAGKSQKMAINSAEKQTFNEADFAIDFSENATLPNGEVVVSKINCQPDYINDDAPFTGSYWAINNYGENDTLSGIQSFAFLNNLLISESNKLNHSELELYARAFNGEGDTWEYLNPANDLQNDKDLYFLNPKDKIKLGQFLIINRGEPALGVSKQKNSETERIVRMYPNPISRGQDLKIFTNLQGKQQIVISDINGKTHIKTNIEGTGKIDIGKLPSGAYLVQLIAHDYMRNEVIIIK